MKEPLNTEVSNDVYYEEVLSTAAIALSKTKSTDDHIHKPKPKPALNTITLGSLNTLSTSSHTIEAQAQAAASIVTSPSLPVSVSDSCSNVSGSGLGSGSESVTDTDVSLNGLTQEEAAKLSSLPQRPIANFPSESDRKRVIGMLATIISMVYQYEKFEAMDYTPIVLEDDDDDGDANADGGGDSSDDGFDADLNDKGDLLSPDSFEEIWERSSPTKDLKGMSEDSISSTSKPKNNPKAMNKSESSASLSSKNSNTGGKNKSGAPASAQASAPTSATSAPTLSAKQQIQHHIELQRYRRRRHKVYSNFLVQSADLLFLDKSNAIAFLPLLNPLLGDGAHDYDPTIISPGIEEGPGLKSNRIRPISHSKQPVQQQNTRNTPGANVTEASMVLNPSDEANGVMLREWSAVSPAKSNHSPRNTNGTSAGNGNNNNSSTTEDQQHQAWDKNDILQPFVESLEPGAGFQCLSLLLLNYLLKSDQGYDARIRSCIKKVGVIIFRHELKHSDCERVEARLKLSTKLGKSTEDALTEMATRKFESLEHTVAEKLLGLSAAQKQQQAEEDAANKSVKTRGQMTRAKIMRGIKIGTAGVAAGTLMAVTGGLAAPGIAAGLAATGVTTAATAGVVTTLTSTAAVTTIFGFGGGSLAAYKTHRRTKGVTEFTFQRQGQGQRGGGAEKIDENAELFSTICISGWLKDNRDFERPWGVEPSNPPITDRLEKLIRFYAIHAPDRIGRCQEILRKWKGEERELWAVLKEKYGQDPDHIYPLYNSPHRRLSLTHEEDEIVDNLLGELGYTVVPKTRKIREEFQEMNINRKAVLVNMTDSSNPNIVISSMGSDLDANREKEEQEKKKAMPFLWDYQMEYGGELLTVKWESDMLVELCDSVADMAADMMGQAAREVLKQTALATLITAVALPYAIVRAADMIDGIWTLAIERADLAGIELAKSLLESEAGHRPVVLVGFSMGARTIYSCLKELARQQEIWEDQQEELTRERAAKKRGMRIGIKKKKENRKEKVVFVREPASIVEDAIMMGLPNHLSLQSWGTCRRIVAGRLVNCYSKNDMILSLMFQIKRLTGGLRPVCGTSAVMVRGVENYNVGSLISAHSDYCTAAGKIMRMIYHGCPHRSKATIVAPTDATYDEE